MPYSPLGKGFLTGKIDENTKFDSSDFRSTLPRFTPEALKANQALIDLLGSIAEAEEGDTRADRAGVAAGAEAVDCSDPRHHEAASPGRKHRSSVSRTTPDDLREIDAAASKITVQGARYPEQLEKMTGRWRQDDNKRSLSSEGIQKWKSKEVGSQPSAKGPADWFTGTVRIDPLFQAPDPALVQGASVTFEPGARTAWHTHPLGQTLIVTAGCGRAQRWGGPIEEIRPGDVVWFSPGEKHWHGAAPTTAMTHIAIQEQLDGKVVDWMEQVSDEQYQAPHRLRKAVRAAVEGPYSPDLDHRTWSDRRASRPRPARGAR